MLDMKSFIKINNKNGEIELLWLTHMNGSWESLTFSQDGESVSQIGDVVFTWDILSFQGFETLMIIKNMG